MQRLHVQLLRRLELQLEELEADAAEAATAIDANADQAGSVVRTFTRRKPVRGPLPAHLPRERVIIPGRTACPCCGGALSKLGETVTETLESVPRQWKVIQTVREKLVCRACETMTQPPAPFAKFGNHQPLNRQSETYGREGIKRAFEKSLTADEVSSSEAPKETTADMASYSTDVSEAAWALIQPHLPLAKPGGRPRSTDLRRVVNAIFY